MYSSIHVPVDNSEHSNAAIDLAVCLGRALGSRLVGSHVYAAKLHDVRFKQMEFTLPDEYKEEEELEKQRKIHDALIARGLHLISDSYLDQMEKLCADAELPFERKHFDGRNFAALVEDIQESDYGLVVLGALGMGAVKNSQLGSVCERVLRRTTGDTLIVRDPEIRDAGGLRPIVACLDGSPHAYGAVLSALRLGKALAHPVQVIAARRADQPEDALLERHLKVAEAMAAAEGVEIETHLLEGEAEAALLGHCQDVGPWLVVLGRLGLDATDDLDFGATAEAVVRQGRWNVLISGQTLCPADDLDLGHAAA